MLLRSAIVVIVLCLGSSLAAAAEPVAVKTETSGFVPVKALAKKPHRKKTATPHPPTAKKTDSSPALTSDQLGLSDYKVSSIKKNENGGDAQPADKSEKTEKSEPAPESSTSTDAKLELGNKDKVLVPEDKPQKSISIELNPLGFAAGRYGANVEYVPFVHHALNVTAFYQTFPRYVLSKVMPTPEDAGVNAAGKMGGEVGYRFYSGRRGANGFFIGASGVIQPLALPRVTPDFKADLQSFYGYGGAVDVGIQGITDSGFTIGGGIGAMYLAYNAPESAKAPNGQQSFSQPHFLPRVLLAAGWSF